MKHSKEHSHFEDDDFHFPCKGPSHNPPTHLWIPPGKKYVHICPTCGHRVEIRSSAMWWDDKKVYIGRFLKTTSEWLN